MERQFLLQLFTKFCISVDVCDVCVGSVPALVVSVVAAVAISVCSVFFWFVASIDLRRLVCCLFVSLL